MKLKFGLFTLCCFCVVSRILGQGDCPVGKYGNYCEYWCNQACQGGCERNGVCKGCQEEWYGDYCQNLCIPPCQVGCERNGTCKGCQDGWYGDYCQNSCISTCQGGCEWNGVCKDCPVGKYGTYCEISCNQACQGGCERNGFCKDCKADYYGTFCQSSCKSTNCLNGRCDRNSGLCTDCSGNYEGNYCSDCKAGYYGADCSSTCRNTNCLNRRCDRNSGVCIACSGNYEGNTCTDCKAGYYGTSCTSYCKSTNCQNGRCDRDSGFCTACFGNYEGKLLCSDCKAGYYGIYCLSSCQSANCLNGRCDRNSGLCTDCPGNYGGNMCYVCKAGYYGNYCQSNCKSTNCPNGRCDRNYGFCTTCSGNYEGNTCSDCKAGYYGHDCSSRCRSATCLNGQCDRDSGFCTACSGNYEGNTCTGCVNGWYGSTCTSHCVPESCKRCDQSSGQCQECKDQRNLLAPDCTECVDGYYRQPSSFQCSPCTWQCHNNTKCDKRDGSCLRCPAGKTGRYCTDACLPGYYGEQCNHTCGHCAGNTVCLPDTGVCHTGCAEEFTGDLCVQALVQSNSSALAGGLVAAIVVIVIAVILVILIIRRRRQAKSAGYSERQEDVTNSNSETELVVNGNVQTLITPGGTDIYAKPMVRDKKFNEKPVIRAKPAKTNGAIYENVLSLSQESESNVNFRAMVHPTNIENRNSILSSTAAERAKGKPVVPVKPVRGRALKASQGILEPEEYDEDEVRESVYSSEETYYNLQPTGIGLDNLQQTVLDKQKDGKLEEEFTRISPLRNYPVTHGQREENFFKNRFNSILPYDKTRVTLERLDNDDASDYINASFIKGLRSEKAYIAAQGPKVNTQDDFWRMVWQEGVTDIVMLTNVLEGLKAKCYEYWPQKGATLKSGQIEVICTEEEQRADFIIRRFDVTKLESREKRRVTQYHYSSWLDHEVPAVTPLVSFWRYVQTRAPRVASAPPLLVHCSAGIGRTGTYIALDIIMDHEQNEEEIDICGIVNQLREDRCHMVQNKGQYEFLHEAVLEAYISRDTRLAISALDTVFPDKICHDEPNKRIDTEFEELCKMRTYFSRPSYSIANQEENRSKNRNLNSLPDDKYLVHLTQHVKGRNQYINASYLPTFLEQRGCILTQLPLPNTLVDVWRLVEGCDVSTIVSIGIVDGEKDVCHYWPEAESAPVKTGPYTISLQSMVRFGDSLLSYTTSMKRDKQVREVHVLHYKGWTEQVPDNTGDLVHLLTTLISSHKNQPGKRVLLQCLDGTSKSGMLCALWNVVSRMLHDAEVDLFTAVRQVHTVKPHALSSLEQYRYCYKVAQEFKNSYHVYANT